MNQRPRTGPQPCSSDLLEQRAATLRAHVATFGDVDVPCRRRDRGHQPAALPREKNAIAIASNQSFFGWTDTFTDPRLCAAIVDRLTYNGTIIETGTHSYRLAHTRARTNATWPRRCDAPGAAAPRSSRSPALDADHAQ